MLFRQSAVVSVDRDRVVEESPTLPVDIHPALVGSGRLAFSLDATGMQGLNTFLGHYPDCHSLEHSHWMSEKHLHIYRDRALSLHYAPEVSRGFSHANPAMGAFSLLPLGYLEYEITVDGRCYGTDEIRTEARAWRRTFDPRQGTLVTSFELPGARVRWTTSVGVDSVSAPFALTIEAIDGNPHVFGATVYFVLKLRDGRPITTGGTRHGIGPGRSWLEWEARNETSAADIYEPASFRWTLAAIGAPQRTEAAGGCDRLSVRAETTGASLDTLFLLIVGADYDQTNTSAYAEEAIDAADPSAIHDAAETWRRYFADGLDVGVGEGDREYLIACAQYTLRAGAPWDYGCPLGTLWTQKFGAMTFWDTFFACDGLLRAGHVEPIRRFADWCVRTAAESGRPHYWMSWYDGVPGSNPETDEGYQSTLAFAQSIIRLAEVSGDDADVRDRALPYLRKLTAYAFESLLGYDAARGWHPVGTVAGDVGIESTDAGGENVIFAWLTSCVAKYAEYAEKLGETGTLVEKARQLSDERRRSENRLDLSIGQWAGWAPNLTQSRPFADYDGWARWMERQVATRPLALQLIMPWLSGNIAVSAAVAGIPNVALSALEHADLHVSGLGYLGESLWEFKCGGNTPYVPSSGVYLAAYAALIADGSVWDNEVHLLCNLPGRWRNNRIRWRNAVTLNGVRVHGSYTPLTLDVEVVCRRDTVLRIGVPSRIIGNVIVVRHGSEHEEIAASDETVTLNLVEGRHSITIRRSESATIDTLLIEPSVHGRALHRILARGGSRPRRVFWLRDTESLSTWAQRAPVIVLDEQYVTMRPDHVEALSAAVEGGARLVALHHAGVRAIDWRMAELTGVNGRSSGDYVYQGARHELALTAGGGLLLPEVPARFDTWLTVHIEPNLAEDVEVLATATSDGRAAVTRRRYGRGWVVWACIGDKLMFRDDPQGEQPNGDPIFSYGFAGGSPFLVFGRYPDELADPRWINEPGFDTLLAALAYAAW